MKSGMLICHRRLLTEKKKLAQELFGGKKNKSQDIAQVLLSIARKIID